jgi:hypothetical protein
MALLKAVGQAIRAKQCAVWASADVPFAGSQTVSDSGHFDSCAIGPPTIAGQTGCASGIWNGQIA